MYFTCDHESIQNKLLSGFPASPRGGATVRLYVCTKADKDGEIDNDASLFIEADIQLLGMSFSVDPDNPTTATINFGVTVFRGFRPLRFLIISSTGPIIPASAGVFYCHALEFFCTRSYPWPVVSSTS